MNWGNATEHDELGECYFQRKESSASVWSAISLFARPKPEY